MQIWRSAFLAKTTLFFFVAMLLFNPGYAQQAGPIQAGPAVLPAQHKLPVMVVSDAEAQRLVGQYKGRGYVVREGTLAQLDEMTMRAEPEAQEAEEAEEKAIKEKTNEEECAKPPRKDKRGNQLDGPAVEQSTEEPSAKELSSKGKSTAQTDAEQGADAWVAKDKKCEPEKTSAADTQQIPQGDAPAPTDLPEPEPVPAPEYPPAVEVHSGVGLQVDLSGGSGGGSNRDFAKVFFIFAGFVVVAAFVVYAGKYISDIVSGKDKQMWRELVFKSTFLSTQAGRHGQLTGVRLATGFVSDELIQLALVGELGSADLNLVLNENTDPTPLDIAATYWMLGASARLHLSTKLVNASYLYLDFMGGTTTNSATDIIGAARLGASFGLNDYWRLGASLGAQYIGLDEGQGFNNDGENYWLTYGVEIGAQF